MNQRTDIQDDEDALWRRGWRVSLREFMMWITAISVALAVPTWFEMPLLPVVFYGTLGGLIWRLPQAMPFSRAALIAVVTAVTLTSIVAIVLPV